MPAPPEIPRYRVNILHNGCPAPITPALPKIRIPPLRRTSPTDGDSSDSKESTNGKYWAASNEYNGDGNNDNDNEDDCQHDIQQMLSEVEVDEHADETSDHDPAPSIGTDRVGPRSNDKTYQFCPPAHRLPILRLFAKHISQHPLLSERHGVSRTSHDIRQDAVTEIYYHCYRNNLTEVWAYMWNNWYARDWWSLWTQSLHPTCISNHRTTMMVEALWHNLKRLVLHNYNCPPVDLTVYALMRGSIPPYRITLSQFLQERGGGRPKGLSNMQEGFKKAWLCLQSVPIKGLYTTDIARWTCDCGAQKYHANLLCKHLVQAVDNIPSSW
jgi:hypothetical protein